MRTLKINLFYDCTAECDHCRFFCRNDEIRFEPDYETPFTLARQLHEHFGLDMAVVLGGEPSLYPARTHSLLSRLSKLGIQTRLETNASWARTPQSSLEFLRPLKSSDTQVMFSLDAFHLPYVSFENVVNAVTASMKLGIPCNLEIPYLDIARKSNPLDRLTKEMDDRILDLFPEIRVCRGNVFFVGKAAVKFGDEFAAGKGIPDEPCAKAPWWRDGDFENTNLVIYEPGGWITKGCGIAIGNIHRQDVTEMIRGYRAANNPIFAKLLQGGPLALAREAEQYGYNIKKEYADRCHLCHEARSILRTRYPEILQPESHYGLGR